MCQSCIDLHYFLDNHYIFVLLQGNKISWSDLVWRYWKLQKNCLWNGDLHHSSFSFWPSHLPSPHDIWMDLVSCVFVTLSLKMVHVLPPGLEEYMSERLIHTSLPLLDNLSMTDPSRAPCLQILLKNLHHLMLNQYQYEEVSALVDVSPCSLLTELCYKHLS